MSACPISNEHLRTLLDAPQIRLHGQVDNEMLDGLLQGLAVVAGDDPIVALEATTLGGDAEVARRIVLEIELARARMRAQRLVFIGKTTVYSAGVTIMSAFPREDRYLTSDTVLLIHGRQLDKTVEISGPMRASLPQVTALKEQLELACVIECKGFERLIAGSDVSLDEVKDRALHSWYLSAQDAHRRKLVANLLDTP